jgi:hypothetical protein
MGEMPALRDVRASNAEHAAHAAARWPGGEVALVESRPREPVTRMTLRPAGALLLLHVEGANSRAAVRCDGEAPVVAGPTLGKLGLFPEGRLAELSADLPGPVRHLALLLAPELFRAEAATDARFEPIELRPSLDLGDPVLLGHARALRAELEAPGPLPLGQLYVESLAAALPGQRLRPARRRNRKGARSRNPRQGLARRRSADGVGRAGRLPGRQSRRAPTRAGRNANAVRPAPPASWSRLRSPGPDGQDRRRAGADRPAAVPGRPRPEAGQEGCVLWTDGKEIMLVHVETSKHHPATWQRCGLQTNWS